MSATRALPNAERVKALPWSDYLVAIRELVGMGQECWITAWGASMAPAILDGDEVLLGATTPRVGAIVLVDRGGKPLMHRIARIDATSVITRGDVSGAFDAPVPHQAVVATAIAARRNGRVVPLTPSLRFGIVAALRHARIFVARTRRELARRRARPVIVDRSATS